MNTKYHTIYGLIDPDTDDLMYVGRTVKTLKERLTAHMYERGDRSKCKWIESLRAQGKKPRIVVLDQCADHRTAVIREGTWIWAMANSQPKLTNRVFKGYALYASMDYGKG